MAAGAFLVAAGATAVAVTDVGADAAVTQTSFQMVRSAVAFNAGCLGNAHARVTVESQGSVEVMKISATGLPPNTDFDVFVTQIPNAPFGIALYQGDLVSGSTGHANGRFIGRFGIETFAVAPGTAPAPVVFNGPFPDVARHSR